MGALVNLTKGDFDFDIPITDIINIEETKRLMSKILVIETQDTEYRFFFTKLEEWKMRISMCYGMTLNMKSVHRKRSTLNGVKSSKKL